MKIYILLLIGVLAIASCSKTEDYSLLKGDWTETNHGFLITLSEDFNFLEIYSKPWLGEIKINGVNIEGDVEYFGKGTPIWGSNAVVLLNSNSIRGYYVEFVLKSNSIRVNYEGEEYIFDNSYLIDLEKGKFVANGIAKSDSNQISIDMNLYAQSTLLKKDVEYGIYDFNSFYWKCHIAQISFQKNKSMQGVGVWQDMRIPFWGDWCIRSKNLILKHTSTPYEEVYSYRLTDNDNLILYEDVAYDDYEIFSSIPKMIIKDLECQYVFARD